MHYEHFPRRLGNAHMGFPQTSFSQFSRRNSILYKLRLKRGKIELKILEQLSRREANAYELKWKMLRGIDVHYSTVLRALRRLEEKKLVRVVSSSKVGRRSKTYACTLLGELKVVLARKGLRAVAKIIAENSPSFRECLEGHFSFDPNYYLSLTNEVIEEIFWSKSGAMIMRPDLDVYVRKIELRWIEENIIEALNNPSSRPIILEYLKKITHIKWISDSVVQVIEKYVENENEWLQTLEDFKREVKLAQFLTDKTEETL